MVTCGRNCFLGCVIGKVAIYIDGSNFLSQLDVCDLGYPALKPLIDFLRGKDELVSACFYSAPQLIQPFKSNWEAFRSANRHVEKLSFFMGYRNKDNGEKAIDVALAVDLVHACTLKTFDRGVVVGGDGDHIYALKVAKSICPNMHVWMMPTQPSTALRKAGFIVRNFEVGDLIRLGVCDRGRQRGVPAAHRAPAGAPDVTLRFSGAFGNRV